MYVEIVNLKCDCKYVLIQLIVFDKRQAYSLINYKKIHLLLAKIKKIGKADIFGAKHNYF
jgi:hypothetical protein